MKCFIVVPTYNECDNISKLAEKIFDLPLCHSRESGNPVILEMIVVDDNSPDGTADEARKLSAKFPVAIITRQKKLGLGSAYIAGFKHALANGADFVFEMDADLSHDPEDVPRLLAMCTPPSPSPYQGEGYDLAIGSRKIAGGKIIGWGWLRKFMSSGACWFSRKILKLSARDVTSGFRCYKRAVLEKINLDDIKSNGYAFQEEMLYRAEKAGFKIAEVPVVFIDRAEGKSKLGPRDVLEFFLTMIRLRLTRQTSSPAKISSSTSL